MKQNKTSNTNLFIIVGIIVVSLIAMFYFMGSKNPDSNNTLESQTSTFQAGNRALALLNQIQELEIDTSIFQSLAFKSLNDYSVAVPPLGVGRPNPFAPIPGVRVQAR